MAVTTLCLDSLSHWVWDQLESLYKLLLASKKVLLWVSYCVLI